MGSNHNHQVLSRNDFGFVSRCSSCGDIQIGMGNVVTSMPPHRFREFVSTINDAAAGFNSDYRTFPNGRKVMIRSSHSSLLLAFSTGELDKLIELFRLSGLRLEARDAQDNRGVN